MTQQIILSPHLDDAIFSCWHIISQPNSEVFTIFSGIPPSGTSTIWDRICGEADSQLMMKNRIRENQIAFKPTNTKLTNLGYLDNQYRKNVVSINDISDKIDQLAGEDAEFYAPLALGQYWRHPDHKIVRLVGQELSKRGRKVSYYTDIPYMRLPTSNKLQYKNNLQDKARRLMSKPVRLMINVLSDQQEQAKLSAMACYKSQLKMTNLVSLGALKRRANIKQEVIVS